MVEVFIKRRELMPSDESIDQHHKKRLEEIAEVDRDRNGSSGLFKGIFPERQAELWFDEADGVLRCPYCAHEHEGGPTCESCGAEFDAEFDDEGYPDFSDLDDDDDDEDADLEELENLEVDLDAELGNGPYIGMPRHTHFIHPHNNVFIHHHLDPSDATNSDNSDSSDMDGDSDEDDDNSLQDFIVRDEDDHQGSHHSNHNPQTNTTAGQSITVISDDESDEGGAISNRRRVRRNQQQSVSISPSAPSVLTVSDTTNESELGDFNDQAEMLRDAGWSPLDQENESDLDDYGRYDGYPDYVEGDVEASDDESDTETMVGHGVSDEEDDDRSREDLSATPRYESPVNMHGPGYGLRVHPMVQGSYTSEDEQADDDDSEAGLSSIMDGDGDTEMSVSPGVSRECRSVSVSSDGDAQGVGEDLGVVNEIHEMDENSSDSSIRPAQRRRPRRYHQHPRVQQYDPRISMMFAQHQLSMRGAQIQENPVFSEWDVEVRRIEPASRSRRLTPYRLLSSRRVEPLRSSQSPSATGIISSSDRVAHIPRQHIRRNYH